MGVKPPGGPPSAPPVPPEDVAEKPAAAHEPFSKQLAGTESVSGAASDLAAEVVRRVRAGECTVEQAVEALLERTLADPALASLSPEHRDALREELREVIAADPVLSRLVAQMGR